MTKRRKPRGRDTESKPRSAPERTKSELVLPDWMRDPGLLPKRPPGK